MAFLACRAGFRPQGFTHSLLAVGGGVALLQLKLPSDWLFPADVLQGMVLGYLSHIVADMLTPAGVPLLWPCRWRFRLPLLRSQKATSLSACCVWCWSVVPSGCHPVCRRLVHQGGLPGPSAMCKRLHPNH